MVSVFDGTRQPIPKKIGLIIRIIDGNQNQVSAASHEGPSILFRDLPFYDNFGDNYTVIVSADGYIQAGFTPVKLSAGTVQHIDLMLLPRDGNFNFSAARWETLQATSSRQFQVLSHGAENDLRARDRYTALMEDRPASLAALLNIATASADIHLPSGTPMTYVKALDWDGIRDDRFFGWADTALLEQVKRAAEQGAFAREWGQGVFHPGATSSYKQVQFGEANVQVTFHENDLRKVDGVSCLRVELDIDYYKDSLGHTFLEVLPNTITQGKTDPKTVSVLRWTAGRTAGVPEFDPPYTIV